MEGFIRIAYKLSTWYRVNIPWPIPKKYADDVEFTFEEMDKAFINRREFSDIAATEWQAAILMREA